MYPFMEYIISLLTLRTFIFVSSVKILRNPFSILSKSLAIKYVDINNVIMISTTVGNDVAKFIILDNIVLAISARLFP